MAQCFCGCGASVKFTRRGANKNGARTDELLGRLNATIPLVEESGAARGKDSDRVVAMLRDAISQGEDFRFGLREYVHGGPRDSRRATRAPARCIVRANALLGWPGSPLGVDDDDPLGRSSSRRPVD